MKKISQSNFPVIKSHQYFLNTFVKNLVIGLSVFLLLFFFVHSSIGKTFLSQGPNTVLAEGGDPDDSPGDGCCSDSGPSDNGSSDSSGDHSPSPSHTPKCRPNHSNNPCKSPSPSPSQKPSTSPSPSASPSHAPSPSPSESPSPSLSPSPSPSTPPGFPSCEDLLRHHGDKAHYSMGMHQIVGGPLMEGSDDVYTLPGNNFAQCFCPLIGSNGIQTNWLRSDQHINGWFFENGSVWDLGDFNYAAQNLNFTCPTQPQSSPSPAPYPSHSPQPSPSAYPSARPSSYPSAYPSASPTSYLTPTPSATPYSCPVGQTKVVKNSVVTCISNVSSGSSSSNDTSASVCEPGQVKTIRHSQISCTWPSNSDVNMNNNSD